MVTEIYGITLSSSKIVAVIVEGGGKILQHGIVEPDPRQMKFLRKMPPFFEIESLRWVVGGFVYYFRGPSPFSDKICSLARNIISARFASARCIRKLK